MKPKQKQLENRTIAVDGMELREAADGGDQPYAEGYGVIYDREVELWPGFFEKIRAGALTRSLNSGDEIKSFINHDSDKVLATTRSDPKLELYDEPKGLRFKAPIPPTSYGKDLGENLRRKNIRGASFMFMVDDRSEDDRGDIYIRDDDGNIHREIVRAVIYEVGPVTNPAYPQTKVNLRSREEMVEEAEARCQVVATKPPTRVTTTRTMCDATVINSELEMEPILELDSVESNSIEIKRKRLTLLERSAV